MREVLQILASLTGVFAAGLALTLMLHASVTGRDRYRLPRHIVPLAISYTMMIGLRLPELWAGDGLGPWRESFLLIAYSIGIGGLLVALSKRARTLSDG